MNGARTLVIAFIAFSAVVTVCWVLLLIKDSPDDPDLTLIMSGIIGGCITLATKAHSPS